MRKVIVFFISLLFAAVLVTSLKAQEFDQADLITGEHIKSFDSNISINKDGTVDVKETIEYDFDSYDRHGIYRDIPFVKTNKEGKKFRLDFDDISVADETGSNYQYKKTEDSGIMRLKIGDPDRTITGVHTYIISYKVSGALTYFSDHDELYWNTTGNEWTVPISHSSSKVNLPVAASTTHCYTGPTGVSFEADCKVDSINTTSSFNYVGSQALSSGSGMTIVVGFPKNTVTLLEPKPYVTFWESIWGKITIVLIIIAALFWYIGYPIWIPIKWLSQGRDPKVVGSGETRAWFDPPKTKKGRSLTPAEVGSLVDEKVDTADISSMIVSLAQRGYLKIVESEKKDFYLHKMKNVKTGSLLAFETLFLTELFASTDIVHLKSKSDDIYKAVEDSKKLIYTQLVDDGFFATDPNKIRTFYTVIGSLAVTTFNLLLAFSAFFFGRNMPKKTEEGAKATAIAKSLRNFLSSQERQLEFQAKNQIFFEKLLPFAVAFGVEKIWADRFKDIAMKSPDWYQGYSSGHFNSILFASSLNSSFSSFNSAATPTTSSSGFSSGSSGGFSGGGGGGGGGGSW